MAIAFQRTQVSMKEIGSTCSVPDNPKAKLMYYLDCIASVLDLRGDLPSKFIDYKKYHALNASETGELLQICQLLSPDVLTDKCIFEMADLNGQRNRFFELSEAKSTVVAAASVMIAGKNVNVAKMMAYVRSWRRDNYDVPFASLTRSLKAAPPPASSRRSKKNDSCVLL